MIAALCRECRLDLKNCPKLGATLKAGYHLASQVENISRFLTSSPRLFQQCTVKVTEVTKTLFLIGSNYPFLGAGADSLQKAETWCWLPATAAASGEHVLSCPIDEINGDTRLCT
ncbi:hypothetical protein Y032_0323g2483 [Ancylostoma ceylanicum]|uniref:Uncharacterized protein n=1 Tax=Ancylostoma ceylanicum TaxID=53326 RepID=A0A016S1H8_9BILA|nr:hypothetical protein Y032_0323g2483 [Ancylostoma ceylanicum]